MVCANLLLQCSASMSFIPSCGHPSHFVRITLLLSTGMLFTSLRGTSCTALLSVFIKQSESSVSQLPFFSPALDFNSFLRVEQAFVTPYINSESTHPKQTATPCKSGVEVPAPEPHLPGTAIKRQRQHYIRFDTASEVGATYTC